MARSKSQPSSSPISSESGTGVGTKTADESANVDEDFTVIPSLKNAEEGDVLDQRRDEMLHIARTALPAIISAYPNYSAHDAASAAFSYSAAMLEELEKRMQTYEESSHKMEE